MSEFDPLEALLSAPLSHDNGHVLREQLSQLASWQYRVAKAYMGAKSELSEMRQKFLYPKEQGKTELDREVRLAADTRSYQQNADTLKALGDSIATNISLGQSMLRGMEQEVKAGVRV